MVVLNGGVAALILSDRVVGAIPKICYMDSFNRPNRSSFAKDTGTSRYFSFSAETGLESALALLQN